MSQLQFIYGLTSLYCVSTQNTVYILYQKVLLASIIQMCSKVNKILTDYKLKTCPHFSGQVLSPTISINHSTALVWNNIEFILIQPKQYLIIWTGFVFSFQILSYFMIPIFSLSMYVGFSNT